MRVAICTPFYGRLEVARLFWAGVDRLREQWSPHHTAVYAGGDELAHREMAVAHDGIWVEHENMPLGKKWNAIVHRAYEDGADYFVIIGSDDLIMPGLAREYIKTMERPDQHYFGIDGLFMVEPATKRALTIRVSPEGMKREQIIAGAGRVLRRDLIEAFPNCEPYSPLAPQGLDIFMTARVLQAGRLPPSTIFPHDGFIDRSLVDVKTETNIWSMERIVKGGGAWLGPEHVLDGGADDPYEHIASFVPEPERKLLRRLECEVASV